MIFLFVKGAWDILSMVKEFSVGCTPWKNEVSIPQGKQDNTTIGVVLPG